MNIGIKKKQPEITDAFNTSKHLNITYKNLNFKTKSFFFFHYSFVIQKP